jgi:hypothetical protein
MQLSSVQNGNANYATSSADANTTKFVTRPATTRSRVNSKKPPYYHAKFENNHYLFNCINPLALRVILEEKKLHMTNASKKG